MDDILQNDPPPPTITSRRDFLRRASKQAAQEAAGIGAKVVPGGAILKRFVAGGAFTGSAGREPSADPANAPTLLQNPLLWLAAWRERRR